MRPPREVSNEEAQWFVERVTYPDVSTHGAECSWNLDDRGLVITLKGGTLDEEKVLKFDCERLQTFFAKLDEIAAQRAACERDADFEYLYYDEEFFNEQADSEQVPTV